MMLCVPAHLLQRNRPRMRHNDHRRIVWAEVLNSSYKMRKLARLRCGLVEPSPGEHGSLQCMCDCVCSTVRAFAMRRRRCLLSTVQVCSVSSLVLVCNRGRGKYLSKIPLYSSYEHVFWSVKHVFVRQQSACSEVCLKCLCTAGISLF
jgi:hypothetical protein